MLIIVNVIQEHRHVHVFLGPVQIVMDIVPVLVINNVLPTQTAHVDLEHRHLVHVIQLKIASAFYVITVHVDTGVKCVHVTHEQGVIVKVDLNVTVNQERGVIVKVEVVHLFKPT